MFVDIGMYVCVCVQAVLEGTSATAQSVVDSAGVCARPHFLACAHPMCLHLYDSVCMCVCVCVCVPLCTRSAV